LPWAHAECAQPGSRVLHSKGWPCTRFRPARRHAYEPASLGPGTPAAPDEHSLLLLPSGPDRVRRSSPRRTRPSTLRCSLSGGEGTTSNGTSTPLERVSGYNGPLLRRLARPPRV